MSYRAFKRLLGETSLERKCRFLFGAGILFLITLSFWLYAYQTEHLAYDQAVTTCRLLMYPIVPQHHVPFLTSADDKLKGKELLDALSLFDNGMLEREAIRYNSEFLHLEKNEKKFDNPYERNLCKEFQDGESGKHEEFKLRPNDKLLLYYAPIRASKLCLGCHKTLAE